jgi:hypothetical protein
VKPSNEKIIEVLRATGGIITAASRQLRISRATLYNWLKADPELQTAYQEISEELLDIAEGELVKLVTGGDFSAVRFLLRCKGKSRGWIEHVTISGPNGGPVQALNWDVKTLTDEQLAAVSILHPELADTIAAYRDAARRAREANGGSQPAEGSAGI